MTILPFHLHGIFNKLGEVYQVSHWSQQPASLWSYLNSETGQCYIGNKGHICYAFTAEQELISSFWINIGRGLWIPLVSYIVTTVLSPLCSQYSIRQQANIEFCHFLLTLPKTYLSCTVPFKTSLSLNSPVSQVIKTDQAESREQVGFVRSPQVKKKQQKKTT